MCIRDSLYSLDKDLAVEANKIAKESIKVFSELFTEYPYDTYSVVAVSYTHLDVYKRQVRIRIYITR